MDPYLSFKLLFVESVALIDGTEIAFDGQDTINGGVFRHQVGFVKIIHVLHVGRTEAFGD